MQQKKSNNNAFRHIDRRAKNELVCPACKGPLTSAASADQSKLECASCQITLPILPFGIIAFFEQPQHAIADSYINLYKSVNQWQHKITTLSQVLKNSERKQALLPVLKAKHDNRDVFERWAKLIEPHVKASALMDTVKQSVISNYGYNFSYLLRDWSNDPNSMVEVNKILSGIKRVVRLSHVRGRACVLGMGTGRFALELNDFFDEIHGIDNSLGQLLQYHDLLERDITFWQINSKNQSHQKNVISKEVASIPEHLKQRSCAVQYYWGDALNTPYKADFFDWVFSIYFSDVKPLPDLVKEVKRILRPDGYFVHCGPLEYHFQDIEHHYSFDEFRDYFLDNGFELMHESDCVNSPFINHKKTLTTQRQYNDKMLLLRLK